MLEDPEANVTPFPITSLRWPSGTIEEVHTFLGEEADCGQAQGRRLCRTSCDTRFKAARIRNAAKTFQRILLPRAIHVVTMLTTTIQCHGWSVLTGTSH